MVHLSQTDLTAEGAVKLVELLEWKIGALTLNMYQKQLRARQRLTMMMMMMMMMMTMIMIWWRTVNNWLLLGRFCLSDLLSFYPNVTTLRSGLCCRNSVCLSVCRLSSVCNVGAPYSGGWSFRQNFFIAVYAGHPLTSVQNFTEIVLGEPLRWER